MESFSIEATLSLVTEAYKTGLAEAERKMKEFGQNSIKSIESVANSLNSIGKSMTVGITAPVVGGVTAAIKSYGNLEQAIGGIETMFGKNTSPKVIENAKDAFKNAGLSATQYMEQVTSFSASLLQSVGGDTEKAANTANMAINDMADNSNKFGTSIDSIQNAYQGFAKQNYTMLDNLKLGYGGTRKEMERLLEDAEKLSGEDYNIDSLDDVYRAIHVIQKDMGVTGTTAKEAAETINGSFTTAKAALDNFLSGLASPDADMGKLTENLVGAVKNVVENVKKALSNIWKNLPIAGWQKWLGAIVVSAGPVILVASKFIGAFVKIKKGLGILAGAFKATKIGAIFATGGIKGLIGAFAAAIGPILAIVAVVAVVGAALLHLWNTNEEFRAGVISVWEGIKSVISGVVDGLLAIWNSMVSWWNANSQMFLSVAQSVWNAIINVVSAVILAIVEVLKVVFGPIVEWWNANQALIMQTVSTVWNAIQSVITTVIDFLAPYITGAINLIVAGWQAAWGVVKGVIDTVWPPIQTLIESVMNAVLGIITGIMQAINGDWSAVWGTVQSVASSIWTAIQSVVEVAINLVQSTIGGVLTVIQSNWETVWGVLSTTVETVFGLVGTAVDTGINGIKSVIDVVMGLITGDWEGTWNTITGIVEGAIDLIKGPIETIMGWFGGAKKEAEGTTETITAEAESAAEAVESNQAKISQNAEDSSTTVADMVTDISNSLDSTDLMITTFLNKISSAMLTGTQTIANNFKSGVARLATISQSITRQVANIFRNLIQQLHQIGVYAGQGFANGLSSQMGNILNVAKGIADRVTRTIRSALDVHSPSQVTTYLGEMTGLGLAVGMAKRVGDAIKSAKNLALASVPDFNSIKSYVVDFSNKLAQGLAVSVATVSSKVNSQIATDATVDVSNSSQTMRLEAKLNQVISAIQEGKTVMLDGRAVGGSVSRYTSQAIAEDNNLGGRWSLT